MAEVHKTLAMKAGICDECLERMRRAGIRLEKKPIDAWYPTDAEAKMIAESHATTTNREIAKRLGVTENVLGRYLEQNGFPSKRNKGYKHLWVEWVRLYEVEKLSCRQIGNRYGISDVTIYKALKDQQVRFRRK